jgi:hypothetical protein
MTTRGPKNQPRHRGSNRQPPWRDDTVGYAMAGDDAGDGSVSFMAAVRRFRARHGLSEPTTDRGVLSDDDLSGLRPTVIDRQLDLDDIVSPSPRPR